MISVEVQLDKSYNKYFGQSVGLVGTIAWDRHGPRPSDLVQSSEAVLWRI